MFFIVARKIIRLYPDHPVCFNIAYETSLHAKLKNMGWPRYEATRQQLMR